jgi:hypothetical protein
MPLAGSLGAEHLAGKAVVGLAEGFGKIHRGEESQGASKTGLLFVQVIGGIKGI